MHELFLYLQNFRGFFWVALPMGLNYCPTHALPQSIAFAELLVTTNLVRALSEETEFPVFEGYDHS